MISERPRNIIVGLTMLVALALLMYGIVLLGKFPTFFGTIGPYPVAVYAPNANGMTPGAHVQLNGVYAGTVKSVGLETDAAGKLRAKVVLQVDNYVQIPKHAVVTLSKPQLGNPVVAIEATDVSGEMLAKDGSASLEASMGDSGLIPKSVFEDVHVLKEQLAALTTRLTVVADDLHVLLAYAPPEEVEKADPNDPKRLRENASTVIIRLNRTMKSIQDLIGDEKLQAHVREIVTNLAEASGKLKGTLEKVDVALGDVGSTVKSVGGAATRASDTLDTAQREIARVSSKLVEMLDQVQKSTRQITEGNGTTGRLINDPRLYDGLLDLSRSLKKATDDLDFLVQKWKDEGVDLRLK